jgi:hypothetical protein
MEQSGKNLSISAKSKQNSKRRGLNCKKNGSEKSRGIVLVTGSSGSKRFPHVLATYPGTAAANDIYYTVKYCCVFLGLLP